MCQTLPRELGHCLIVWSSPAWLSPLLSLHLILWAPKLSFSKTDFLSSSGGISHSSLCFRSFLETEAYFNVQTVPVSTAQSL